MTKSALNRSKADLKEVRKNWECEGEEMKRRKRRRVWRSRLERVLWRIGRKYFTTGAAGKYYTTNSFQYFTTTLVLPNTLLLVLPISKYFSTTSHNTFKCFTSGTSRETSIELILPQEVNISYPLITISSILGYAVLGKRKFVIIW